jgi:dolichyl-diphosphooligosaccharide--protein glycosyltransferase
MFGAGSFLKGDFLSRVSSGILLAAFLFPPVFASALLAARRKRGEDTLPVAVFAFWSAVVLALALSQKRWVNAYSVNVAVAAGWGASLLLRDGLGSARAVRAWAALALLSVPLLAGLRESVLEPPPPFYEPDIRESLSWMRENTPRTPGLYELSTDPGYSVLSTWSNGHYIQLLGERPTVANNFGYQLPGEGLEDTLRYRFAADEAAMAEVCARRRVRFVYATAIGDILTSNGGLARLVGIDFKERFMTRQALPGGGTAESLDFRAFMSLPSVRLFIHDGAESRGGPAFGRFRLAYESATEVPLFPLPPGIRSVKIFEFVPGAVVKGRSAPGREIVLSCRMQSSQGREFEYRSTVMADGEGRFSARFPYATTWPAWAVAPLGRASASSSAGSVSFDVRDADVLEGREIELRVP